MRTDRREALRTMGGVLGLVVLQPEATKRIAAAMQDRAHLGSAELALDEPFWEDVARSFEVIPGVVWLGSIVRGVMPTRSRETLEAETRRLNQMQPHAVPDPDFPARLRAQAAAFIGARPEQVALNRNTTDGFTAVVMGWPLTRGDEILTSSQEHGPFYGTFAMREARDGVTWRTFHIPTPAQDPKQIVEAVERAIGPKTRLVVLCHAVLTGQILPIAEIAQVVHARGALLLVDGALSLGHVATDVQAMGCDFFAGSFHKAACGPTGTGILYVKPEHVERLMPLYGWAREENGRHQPLWNSPTMDKFQSFGQHPQSTRYGLSASLAFLTAIGMDRIQARLFELTRYWVERARGIPGIRFAAPLDPRLCASLMGWEVTGTDSTALSRGMVAERIYMGGTGPYAGVFGIPEDAPRGVRCVNTALFLTRRELDRFTETLARVGAATRQS